MSSLSTTVWIAPRIGLHPSVSLSELPPNIKEFKYGCFGRETRGGYGFLMGWNIYIYINRVIFHVYLYVCKYIYMGETIYAVDSLVYIYIYIMRGRL